MGEQPPEHIIMFEEVEHFIRKVDQLLRREHDEDYYGIVYANNPEEPAFIKIFDPNNLEISCESNGIPPLPGWILSKYSQSTYLLLFRNLKIKSDGGKPYSDKV